MEYMKREIRLETEQEFKMKLDAMEALNKMLEGTLEFDDDVDYLGTRSPKAPRADYSKVASLALTTEPEIQQDKSVIVYETATYDTVTVPVYEHNAYFYAGMHLPEQQRDEELYDRLVANKINVPISTPQIVNQTDGQLKICVDFVIGVDQAIVRRGRQNEAESFKILVIGSASEWGVSSLAYNSLDHIYYPLKIEIDLYDPYEVDREYTNYVYIDRDKYERVYRHHRQCYAYDVQDIVKYDLVFDDAYNMNLRDNESQRVALDPNKVVLQARDYSIKRLPVDKEYFVHARGSVYVQALQTKARETRFTKYPREYGPYKKSCLGRCAACNEVRYMVARIPDALAKYLMLCHKVNCVTKSRGRNAVVSVDPVLCCQPECRGLLGHVGWVRCTRHMSFEPLISVVHLSSARQLKAANHDRQYEVANDLSKVDMLFTVDRLEGRYVTREAVMPVDLKYLNRVVFKLGDSEVYLVDKLVGSEVSVGVIDNILIEVKCSRIHHIKGKGKVNRIIET